MAKQSNKLTAKTVQNLRYDPESSNKHSDGAGLYLLISKNGSKYWRMNYRRPISKKENTLAIGTYPSIRLEEARLKRDEFRRMLADGIDPAEERNTLKRNQQAKLKNTFAKYAEEWLQKRELENKVDKENIRRLNKDILPYIGHKPVEDLTPEQLEIDVTNRMIARGALESARRVKSIMGLILQRALKLRIISYNPACDITIPLPTKGNFNAIVDELELQGLLLKIWSYCSNHPRARKKTELLIKLSAYTFQRPGELRELRWESVNFENQCLTFKANKTNKDHIVPLCRQTYDILKELELMRTTSEYVFPSIKSNLECLSTDTVRQALIRLGFKGKHTQHGFRATARTILGEQIEYRLDIVEHQLAHTVKDPNGTAYNRTKFLRRRRELMQLWADYLDTLRQGGDVSSFKPQDDKNFIKFSPNVKTA